MLFQVIRLSIMFVCFVKYELLLWIHIAKVKLYLRRLIFYFLRYFFFFSITWVSRLICEHLDFGYLCCFRYLYFDIQFYFYVIFSF